MFALDSYSALQVMTVSTATKVPVVTATQKLADFTVATFDTTAKDSVSLCHALLALWQLAVQAVNLAGSTYCNLEVTAHILTLSVATAVPHHSK